MCCSHKAELCLRSPQDIFLDNSNSLSSQPTKQIWLLFESCDVGILSCAVSILISISYTTPWQSSHVPISSIYLWREFSSTTAISIHNTHESWVLFSTSAARFYDLDSVASALCPVSEVTLFQPMTPWVPSYCHMHSASCRGKKASSIAWHIKMQRAAHTGQHTTVLKGHAWSSLSAWQITHLHCGSVSNTSRQDNCYMIVHQLLYRIHMRFTVGTKVTDIFVVMELHQQGLRSLNVYRAVVWKPAVL